MVSTLHAIVLFPFLLALIVPRLYHLLGRRLGWAILPFPFAVTLYLLGLLPTVGGGDTLLSSWAWAPSFGIHLSLMLDGFGLLFALLIAGIGTLVVLYSIFYLGPDEDLGRFYISVLLFMGAMFGVVLSENLLSLYVFWEITSFSSFLLIGFWYAKDESRAGALKSILITVTGGFALLAGILLLGAAGGTFSIRELLGQVAVIQAHPYYPAIVGLILLGAFTKSAQVPFHLWLPGAMAAPTPVSAYLHSATMVKAGIFLTAKMGMLLGGTGLWFYVVAGIGMATMFLGSYLAVQQRDLKGLLAFSTISQLGLIITMFAYGTVESLSAGILHILNHGIFKASLFMLVGIIDHETGTREIDRLRGLRRAMPVTAMLMFFGAFAMAGLPLLNGFVSKEMIFMAMLEPPIGPNLFTSVVPVVAVLGSAFTVVYCLIIAHKIFFGPLSTDTPVKPHEASWGLLFAPTLLSVLIVWLGLSPQVVEQHIVAAGTASLAGTPVSLHLALWHGFNWPLVMSIGAILVGGLLYWRLGWVTGLLRRLSSTPYHMNALYEWSLDALDRGTKRFNARIMTGNTRDYLVFIFGFTAVAVGYTLLRTAFVPADWALANLAPITWTEAAAIVVMIAGALTAVFVRQRIAAALAVGAVGFMVAILWVVWRAPDLALTQTIVETVTLVPLAIAFTYLPKLRQRPFRPRVEGVNAVVAVALGLLAGGLTLAFLTHRLFGSIGEFFVENSYTLGGGRNIVNVMLVDFRGLDTLGEITVLSLVALAVYTLVRSQREGSRPAPSDVPSQSTLMLNPLILPAVARVLFFMVLVFSVYLFFRGHHYPGGGFIGGMMAVTSMLIWALAFERTATVRLVPVHPRYLLASGLLTVIALGIAPMFAGYPFLTQFFGYYEVPFLGQVELATALLFDLGVAQVVFGATYWFVITMADGTPLGRVSRRPVPAVAATIDDAEGERGEAAQWKS